MRIIKIRFYISSTTITMDKLSKMIGIEPCYYCTKFHEGAIAKPYWCTEIVSDALCIEEPLAMLKERIVPRLEEIAVLCKENLIKTSFEILVQADYAERPEITLPPEFFPLFEQLNAELNFDIAYEC